MVKDEAGSTSAAGANPPASAGSEFYEVLSSWPSVTASGSFVKVVNMRIVRETPNELRLRRGELEDLLDPKGVMEVGGAPLERDVRRGHAEVVVKWRATASLAARELAPPPLEPRAEAAAATQAARPVVLEVPPSARRGGGAETLSPLGGRSGATGAAPPTPRPTPAAARRSSGLFSWSFGAGSHALAGGVNPIEAVEVTTGVELPDEDADDGAARHPERPDRVRSIFKYLHAQDLMRDVIEIPGREASRSELVSVHSDQHIAKVRASARRQPRRGRPV